MKYALVCPTEPALDGYRVAQVTEEIFAVAEPLYWLKCADDVVADEWYFDLQTSTIIQKTGLQKF